MGFPGGEFPERGGLPSLIFQHAAKIQGEGQSVGFRKRVPEIGILTLFLNSKTGRLSNEMVSLSISEH